MLMPYIEIDLSKTDDGKPLFEKVILGPSPHPNLSIHALANI